MNLPPTTAGQIAALIKQSRRQKNSSIEIPISRDGGDILLRETLVTGELDQVFNLIYRVYVEEMRIVDANALPSNQAKSKQKFDGFDFAPSTRHLVAVQNNRVVGCMRLVDEVEGVVPIERNGFSLESERRLGYRIREISKLIIEPSHRRTGICNEFVRLALLISSAVDDIHVGYFSCEPRLERFYALLGCVRIGQFENVEFNRVYSVMRADSSSLSTQSQRKQSKGAEVALQ